MRISDWSSDVCSSDLGSAENAALPIDVIGVEELADRGIPSILDLLKAMPSSSGAVGDTNLISSAALGRVEVLKDGASARSGSGRKRVVSGTRVSVRVDDGGSSYIKIKEKRGSQ